MKQVPRALAQTWITLLKNNEASDEVKLRAASMLPKVMGMSEEKKAIETLISVARSSNSSEDVRMKSLIILSEALGKPEEIAIYMKRNNIK